MTCFKVITVTCTKVEATDKSITVVTERKRGKNE